MMISLSEAKAHLARYVAKASEGEIITICTGNKPLARLCRATASPRPRKVKIGVLKGMFKVPDNFDAPLPEFETLFYGGKPKKFKSRRGSAK
jgi:antitoxin (DNA-binding transcriptional repressor) of toxin-antitoxin stability system